MKVCPKCGKVVAYNSYFGAYMCSDCDWEERVSGAFRDRWARPVGISTVLVQKSTAFRLKNNARAKALAEVHNASAS